MTEEPSTVKQFVAASVCGLSCVCCGLCFGWSSYSIPLLFSENNSVFPEPITKLQGDLIGGIPSLGGLAGTTLFSWSYDKYGRKRGALLLALPVIISWLLILFAPSPEYVVVSRFLAGMGGGGAGTLAPLYIGETADVSIRGALGSFLALGFTTGILLSFIIGSIFAYYTTAIICLGSIIVFVVLMSFMPETPVFLMKKGMDQEAEKSVAWLRSLPVHSPIVQEEIAYLRSQIKTNIVNENTESVNTNLVDKENKYNVEERKTLENPMLPSRGKHIKATKRPAWKELALDEASRKAFLVAAMMLAIQVLVGLLPIQTYAADIFSAVNPDISPRLCSIIFAVASVVGCAVSSLLADRAGRKALMVATSAGIAFFMFIIGLTLQTGFGPNILPTIAIYLCVFLFYIGAGSIPFVFIGECFSNELKDLAACVLIQYVAILTFLITFFMKTAMKMLNVHGIFYFFGFASALATIFCAIFQPETKGLNQEQIIQIFARDNSKSKSFRKIIELNE